MIMMNGLARKSSSYAANSSQVNSSTLHAENGEVSLHSLGKQWMTDNDAWDLPFLALPGERLEHSYNSKENHVILTNYRLIVCLPETFYITSIRNIEYVEMRDLLELWVHCKDARTFRACFDIPEASTRWWQQLTTVTATPGNVTDLFAFCCHHKVKKLRNGLSNSYNSVLPDASSFISELKRLEFDVRSIWRISEINSKFEICQSYPKFHIVPAWTSDKDVTESAKFRSIGRFPSVVWRDVRNGAVLARSSQPEVGLLGWRCNEDEKLLSSIAKSALQNSWTNVALDTNKVIKPFLIIDARSYTAAFANRAKGGGFEYQEYYADCQVQFMSLTNIHGIRKSFHSLRTLCMQGQDQSNWLSSLESTKWLQYLSVLLRASTVIVNAIDKEGQSVLVHCSDGWDRTAQLMSLAELLMDPFYRTIKGFQVLIEREWLDFGHKFGDRCGHSPERDVNERSPVFLQWLDCVHQILRQFPTSFQFNEHLLVKLAMHTYSCLYGTFLCNNLKERQDLKIKQNTSPIWALFKSSKAEYKNSLYVPYQRVLYPNYQVRCLSVWEHVFMPTTPKFSDVFESEDLAAGFNDSGNYNGEITVCVKDLEHNKEKLNKGNNANGHCSEEGSSDVLHCNGYLKKGLKVQSEASPSQVDDILKNNGTVDTNKVVVVADQRTPEDKNDLNQNKNILNKADDTDKDKEISSIEDGQNNQNRAEGDCGNKDDTVEKKVVEKKTNGCTEEGKLQINGKIDNHCANETVECVLSEENSQETMQASTTSSTKTITSDHNTEIELSILNLKPDDKNQKSEENSTSEPTTPVSSKFKGHRRTHSSDGSPIKAVLKTASYSEGMSSSAYYSQESSDKHSINTSCNPIENVGLICRFLSSDGLLKSEDLVQQRLQEIDAEHRAELRKMQKRFEIERQARLAIAGRKGDDHFSGSSRKNSENCDDMLSLPDSTNCEIRSVSSVSNDESWENVQFEDAQATRWVPDHVVNGCAICDSQFNLVVRKHHCRKCGRILCGACADRYLPLPDEQLYEPVRVCNDCFGKHYNS